VASQKFTVPDVIVFVPDATVAVSVTMLPEDKEVTGLPPEVAARVVVEVAIPGSVYVAVATGEFA
jgi:hypothetical protein